MNKWQITNTRLFIKEILIEMLIREIGCGKIAEPQDYKSIEENLKWDIIIIGKNNVMIAQ